MKILILNGSPRCQGLISRMLDIMAEEARIRGAAWLAAAGRPVSYPKTMRSARFKRYNGQTC